jgi:hypothetical protein
MKTTRIIALVLLGLSTLNPQLSTAFGQGTAFNYQGRLSDNGAPANGTYDLQFTIYDSLTGGSVVGGPIFIRPTEVSNGLFTVTLDFGAGAFTGPPRFLEIGVRTNDSDMDHTPLSPRQPILATPYAITAGNLAGTLQATQLNGVLASAQLAGVYSGAVTFSNASNSFSGDGSGLTNVSLDSSAVWKLAGNSNTIPGTHFVGTRDNQPLELQVNRQRALRLEPNTNGAPNVIGGSAINLVDLGVAGATIGGGGATNFGGLAYTNRVSGSFGTIAGGGQNTIATNAFAATIAGGFQNTIQTDSFYSTVGGGRFNHVMGGAAHATIGGGQVNRVQTGAAFATIPGGQHALADSYGQWIYSSGAIGNPGDAQTSLFVVKNQTTNAAPTELFLDWNMTQFTPGTRRIQLPGGGFNSTWTFDALVVGRSTTGASAGFQIRDVIESQSGTTALVGTPSVTALGAEAGAASWSVSAQADDTNDALLIKVTGATATTIRWVASVRTVEVKL